MNVSAIYLNSRINLFSRRIINEGYLSIFPLSIVSEITRNVDKKILMIAIDYFPIINHISINS